MEFDLKNILRALLFSSGQPLSIKDVQAAFTRFHDRSFADREDDAAEAAEGPGDPQVPADGADATPADPGVPSLVTSAQIREAMDAIAAELRADDKGLVLTEGPNGYRLATHPRYARWIRALRQEPPPARLSQSSLETLAVVAYRQPVTRSEIEAIRGVSAEAGINKLLERELISITGRADLPGRPLQYATTDRFLELVGLRSLDEMPASDVLSTRQIDEWLRKAADPHKPGDAEMGLEENAAAPAS